MTAITWTRRHCVSIAPLGTHKRFIGFLLEHYSGDFPLWLAPELVRVLTLGAEGDPAMAGPAR